MRFVIVTGMSGAGKTTVLKFLEDIGFFCVDNLPPALITKFSQLCFEQDGSIDKVALGIDIRGGKLFGDLFVGLKELKEAGYDYEILYLDASDATLIKRYKESRRSHPLSRGGSLETGIGKERAMLADVRQRATYIIDTSSILTRELKIQINKIFKDNGEFDSLIIKVCSFGFKYGIPMDADLVFDVRFLPNPYYIQELREFTGNDAPVRDVYIACTHGVLSGPAVDRLKDCVAKEVIITDTIAIPEEKRFDKLVQISVAELLAYTIESIENDLPVSDVFKHFDFKGE